MLKTAVKARMPSLWLPEKRMQFYPPPPSGAVLYLPGYPGRGSTIQDFSLNFVDSTVNTNEEVDISETGIDVTPDATTLIPVGSTIKIDNEQMLVSATGLTLTVTRGYNGTTPATHATATDVYIKTANHGTITGAVWARLPSGLWVLDFDGIDDHVDCGNAASLDITGSITVAVWSKITTAVNGDYQILSKRSAWGVNGIPYELQSKGGGFAPEWRIYAASEKKASGGLMVLNTWHHIVGTYDGANLKLYIDGVLVATTASVQGIPINAANVTIGKNVDGERFKGSTVPVTVLARDWTLPEVVNGYQRERHLFGV